MPMTPTLRKREAWQQPAAERAEAEAAALQA